MVMPTWDQFMAPVLRVLTDGETRSRRWFYDRVADDTSLTEEERATTLKSGQLMYENRIGWATSHLNRVGGLDRPSRGRYVITDVGRRLLAEHPAGISERDTFTLADDASTRHSPLKPRTRARAAAPIPVATTDDSALDPVEQIEAGIGRIHADVSADLLTRLHAREPAFFEQAVLDLLMAMGYGGAEGTATRTQLSNDGGIDGVIDQDALGLSRSMCRPSAMPSTRASAGPRSRPSSAPSTATPRTRASTSRPRASAPGPRTTPKASRPGSC